jgi:hypothetical protein
MHATLFNLFAEQTRQDLFRDGFRSRGAAGHDDVLLGLLIVATLIAGMWAISRLVSMRRRQRGYNNPWKLFWALSKAHHLNWSDSWLLRRVARDLALRDPGRLFVEAELWDERKLRTKYALESLRLKELRTKILGAPSSAAPEPALRPAASPRPTAVAATPLFPSLPTPTLDVPPWTVES